MFSVSTLTFDRLYAVVIMGHARSLILHTDVTDHPTALWLARQITEAFPWDSAPKVLVRDNDGAYGLAFRRRVCALGIQDRPITPYCPWQNGYVERLIGSIKRECVNHFIIFDARHPRRLLRAYARYYNRSRTHLGLGGQTPIPRSEKTVGRVVAIPVLGGLHHRYVRDDSA